MSTVVIDCEGIGKRYRVGQPRQRYRALRDTLTDAFRAPFLRFQRTLRGQAAAEGETSGFLWALDGVSFQVHQGEVLGVVGRNGAGKSTLLKVLSRITKPTTGRAQIRGRVGALLEVGTGFHPELTGRENIYLNGAVLGMTRREIEGKFDEIVDFSECGRFLDEPVKHYSSGMYMRLAFAVAAHLETEILLMDEVLAVGDAAFQKKCLGKMGEAAHQGRTVLFVSHNLLAVDSLCTRAICLHDGKIVMEGSPAQVTSSYLQKWLPATSEVVYDDMGNAPGIQLFRLRRACVRTVNGAPSDLITVRTPFIVEFEYWKLSANRSLDLGVDVYNERGIHLFETGKFGEPPAPAGLLRSSFVMPGDVLNNGTHTIRLTVWDGCAAVFRSDDLLVFEVHDAVSNLRGLYHGPLPGAVRPYVEWKTVQCGSLPMPGGASPSMD